MDYNMKLVVSRNPTISPLLLISPFCDQFYYSNPVGVYESEQTQVDFISTQDVFNS